MGTTAMRGIIGVLAAFSAISFAMNVAQVTAGNACDVTEEPWRNAVDQCSCENPGCQLDYSIGIPPAGIPSFACKEAATSECREAVKQWARAYREAPNAADPKCHGEDGNYVASQRAAENCTFWTF